MSEKKMSKKQKELMAKEQFEHKKNIVRQIVIEEVAIPSQSLDK